ncbi:unnamed protein product [Urochloa humidicola]
MPQIAVQDFQNAPNINWRKPHKVQVFTFKELAKATNNFARDKKIGQGGVGSVYMGWLPDRGEVAIKRVDRSSKQTMVGLMEDFKAELTILPSISHKHIVRLFGYCVSQEERQLLPKFWKKDINQEALLVYEFMENRSLDMHLHGRTSTSPVTTSWKMRIEILLGVSRAIEYLQSYAERPVIHGDVKSSNILLDVSWAPRLTDFGSALTWEGPDHVPGKICGTYGYIPPRSVIQ